MDNANAYGAQLLSFMGVSIIEPSDPRLMTRRKAPMAGPVVTGSHLSLAPCAAGINFHYPPRLGKVRE